MRQPRETPPDGHSGYLMQDSESLPPSGLPFRRTLVITQKGSKVDICVSTYTCTQPYGISMDTEQKWEGAIQQDGVLGPHKHAHTHTLKCTNKQSLRKTPGMRSDEVRVTGTRVHPGPLWLLWKCRHCLWSHLARASLCAALRVR